MDVANLKAVIDADSKPGEEGLTRFHGLIGKAAEGMHGLALGMTAAFAGTAVLGGIGLLVSHVGEWIQSGKDANLVQAQTQAVLKSTAGVAGMTAASVDALSNRYMQLTGIDDDVVKSTENMLLTFTNISAKGGVFDQATKTVLDMSVALGQDTKNSAIQLGKALNDPIKGVSALQRVGVTFDAQQKEQIKTMMAHGNIAGAQAIILKELNKEFGGSAEAAGKANGGMKILSAELNNMGQSIGQAIIPILGKLLGAVSPLVTAFANNLPGALDKVGGFITNNVQPVIDKLGRWFLTEGVPALQRFGGFIMGTVVPALQQLGLWAQAHILPVFQAVATVMLTNVLPALQGIWQQISANLLPVLQRLWEHIEPVLIPALQFVGWIIQNVVGPAIGFLITVIGTLVGWVLNVADKIGQVLTPILAKLHEWLDKHVNPVLEKLGYFFREHIVPAAKKLGDYISTQLQPIFQAIGDYISITVMPTLKILGDFVGTAIVANFQSMGDAIGLVFDQVGKLLDALGHVLTLFGIVQTKSAGIASIGNTLGGGGKKHFASGGITSGGPFIGAEQGPELLLTPGVYSAPAGSRVVNASDTRRLLSGGTDGGNGGGGRHQTINIYPQHADFDSDDLSTALRRLALLGNTGGGY